MKHILTILMIAMIAVLGSQTGACQIVTSAKMGKKEYVAYENITLAVTLNNRSGRQIDFVNQARSPWIEFVVERISGNPIFKVANFSFSATRLRTGETKTSTFSLNNVYNLSTPGNYTAYAIIRMPGQNAKEGTNTNKVHFTVINGRAVWKQRAGVPGTPGDTREYRIMNVQRGDSTELYVQVEDVKRNKMLATYSMGRNLAFREFRATLDNKNQMHVLFLTSPTIWSHTVVNAAGKTVRRQYHKKGPGGVIPKLITTDNGVVGVMNSSFYDPDKVNDLRSQLHNLSELPLGL